MDVNSVMNINNMNNLLNTVYKTSDSKPSMVPMVGSIDATVKNDYNSASYFGKDTDAQLQDIYEKVDPALGMPLTYNKSGDMSLTNKNSSSIDGISPESTNLVSLLQSNDSPTTGSDLQSILSQYTAVEAKTFQPNISSALSANIYNSSSTAGSLANASMQNTSNFLNTFA